MTFDPYHKWLGIAPKDQPPNHYRLLAIDLFESDPEVIDAAANRQMAYLQQRAHGMHAALSQKLLNGIAAARVCLLNPKKKAEYDAELKAKLAEKDLAAGSLNPDLSELEPSPVSGAQPMPSVLLPLRPVRARRSFQPEPWQYAVAIGVAALLGIGGWAVFTSGGKAKRQVAVTTPERTGVPPEKQTAATPSGQPKLSGDKENTDPAATPDNSSEASARSPDQKSPPSPPVTTSPDRGLTTGTPVNTAVTREFISLFDGSTLNGWQGETENFKAGNGVLVCRRNGGRLFTTTEYADFILRFDFKLEPGANNGIALRTPMGGHPAGDGMEIQILDDDHPKHSGRIKPYQRHGSIYGVVAAEPGYLKSAGEWNSEEIVCEGRHVRVTLNGAVILDTDLSKLGDETPDHKPHPGLHRTKGYVGFVGQAGSETEFRNVLIKELEPSGPTANAQSVPTEQTTSAEEGVVEPGNVALASNGTTVTGPYKGELHGQEILDDPGKFLIDCQRDQWSGLAKVPLNEPCILTLPKVYKLSMIRMNLVRSYRKRVLVEDSYYQYTVEVSRDGSSYETVADRTSGQWCNWQTITFAPRPVKTIRIVGTKDYPNQSGIRIAEIEAYCLPNDPITQADSGESLNGWEFVVMGNEQVDPTPYSVLQVSKEGTLSCTAGGGWFLATNRTFAEMLFTIEFQYPVNSSQRADGVVIVATANPAEGLSWAKDRSYRRPAAGIEVKLSPEKCGALTLPREDFRAEMSLGQVRDGRRVTPVRTSDAALGRWHKLEIECNSHRDVTVKLNGELVNAIAKAENISGRIALWAMGRQAKFRNPTVTVNGKQEKLDFNITGVIRPKK